VNFFFDNTFGPNLARAVKLVAGPDGHDVLHMLDLFPEDPGDDTIWIPAVAAKEGNWVVLSGDRRLLTSPQNCAALTQAQLSVFVMPAKFHDGGRMPQAERLFKYLPEIVKAARTMKRGQCFDVQMNGRIREAQKKRA
jgi:hypothetical protein